MARHLDVYLHNTIVGQLFQDETNETTFQYVESWLRTPGALPVSHSLPLREGPFSRRECAGFFGGILPEGEKRQVIARNLGISARNDVAMLEEIGGECGGAITFLRPGESLSTINATYEELTEAELASRFRQLPRRPLLAGDKHLRLSLAGAQDKLPVCLENGRVSLPENGAPSTHILKPEVGHFKGIVRNELVCMQLAHIIGLSAANVTIANAEEIEYLIVERYDRTWDSSNTLIRIHQEDFCQALGIVSENKYQAEGGPSIAQCVQLLRSACSTPAVDINRFVDAVIFNFLIGNNDAHGKNFSLLYNKQPDGLVRTTFAPLYDVVCTRSYPELSSRMAMKIGHEYDPDRVQPRHFDQLAAEASLNATFLRRRVVEIADLVTSKLRADTPDNFPAQVTSFIMENCRQVLSKFRN